MKGAGFCRTDLHIMQGWFNDVIPVELPAVLGHENAGWVEAVAPGRQPRRRRRRGAAPADVVRDVPGLPDGPRHAPRRVRLLWATSPGGFAEHLKTSARAVVKLPAGVQPKDIADGGGTQVVLDFVGEGTVADGVGMLGAGGSYFVVG